MGFIKKAYGKAKEYVEAEYEYKKKEYEVSSKAKREEGLVQAKRFAKEREKIKTDDKLKRLKQSEGSRSGFFGGAGGPTRQNSMSLGDALLGGSSGKKRKNRDVNKELNRMLR